MAKPKVRPEPIATTTADDDLNDAALNMSTSPSDVRNLRKNQSNNSPKELSPTSFARRRTSSQTLPPLIIQTHFQEAGGDYVDGVKTSHFFRDQNAVGDRFREVQDEGVFLYHETFLKPEISRRGLEEPETLQQAYHENVPLDTPSTTTPIGYKNPKWAKAGKELRIVADKFAKSKERAKLTKKANKYSQSFIQSYDQFSDLLSELFQAGRVTRERLVVLFFFCSDLTIIALEHNYLDYFSRLVRWTFQYIREGLSQWIISNGGWEAIVDTTRTYVDIVFKVAVIVAVGTFLYSRFRR